MKTEVKNRQKELIDAVLARVNLVDPPPVWREDADGMVASLGDWRAVDDEPSRMYEVGERGELTACVVGAPEYRNERVAFYFIPEGNDSGAEVDPFVEVEPA